MLIVFGSLRNSNKNSAFKIMAAVQITVLSAAAVKPWTEKADNMLLFEKQKQDISKLEPKIQVHAGSKWIIDQAALSRGLWYSDKDL